MPCPSPFFFFFFFFFFYNDSSAFLMGLSQFSVSAKMGLSPLTCCPAYRVRRAWNRERRCRTRRKDRGRRPASARLAADEYRRDGGDEAARPAPAATPILGVGMEDTVAVYETRDGQTRVQPSNEVFLYAPRSAPCARSSAWCRTKNAIGPRHPCADGPTRRTMQLVGNTKQNIQLGDQIAARPPSASA